MYFDLANSGFGGEYGRYLSGRTLVRKTEQTNRKQNETTRIENRASSTGNVAALQRNSTRVNKQATQLETGVK